VAALTNAKHAKNAMGKNFISSLLSDYSGARIDGLKRGRLILIKGRRISISRTQRDLTTTGSQKSPDTFLPSENKQISVGKPAPFSLALV
jgi:hypothetical protein